MLKRILMALMLVTLMAGCVLVPYDDDGYYHRDRHHGHRDHYRNHGSHHGGYHRRYSDHRDAGHQW